MTLDPSTLHPNPGVARQAAESARAQGKAIEVELDQLRSQLASLEKQVGAAQDPLILFPKPRLSSNPRAYCQHAGISERALPRPPTRLSHLPVCGIKRCIYTAVGWAVVLCATASCIPPLSCMT